MKRKRGSASGEETASRSERERRSSGPVSQPETGRRRTSDRSADRANAAETGEQTLSALVRRRLWLLGAAVLLLFAVFLIRGALLLSQPIRLPGELAAGYTTRIVKISGTRGQILDRSGKVLAGNAWDHRILLTSSDLRAAATETRAEWMCAFAELLLANHCPAALTCAVLPVEDDLSWNCTSAETQPWYRAALFADRGPEESEIACLLRRFGLSDAPESPETALALRMLYDMEVYLADHAEDADGTFPPYTVAEEIASITVLTSYKSLGTPAVSDTVCRRVYPYDGYASHLLGRVGRIRAETLDYYSALGYPMDAVVGVDGLEAAYESVLRGTDGELRITTDPSGHVVEAEMLRAPADGMDVMLTLDIVLQIEAEQALADSAGAFSASGGALVVTEVGTGAVLASASWPTYTLSDYTARYSVLAADPLSPLFNRALSGAYAPGSVMKLCVAAAALETGTITPGTVINDTGIYTYYDDYQPRCWLYVRDGTTHGSINVRQAITVSCNCFFFETARRLGIDSMNRYAAAMGLGRKTGVGLTETAGVLAGPSAVTRWTAGDTLQAAIGQSVNAVTPVQLSVYTAALLSGGSYTGAHLCMTDAVQPIQTVSLSERTVSLLREAMHDGTLTGTAGTYFSALAHGAGIKTGTAQTGDEDTNAVMVGYYPYDAPPRIAVSAVLEEAGGGALCSGCVSRVMRAYETLYYDCE